MGGPNAYKMSGRGGGMGGGRGGGMGRGRGGGGGRGESFDGSIFTLQSAQSNNLSNHFLITCIVSGFPG